MLYTGEMEMATHYRANRSVPGLGTVE